jgi:hypothetical protein
MGRMPVTVAIPNEVRGADDKEAAQLEQVKELPAAAQLAQLCHPERNQWINLLANRS